MGNKQNTLPRIKLYGIRNPVFPEVTVCQHLINYLSDIGEAMKGASGLVAISWTELNSWAQVTKTDLSSWESRSMVRLSRIYVSCYYRFRDPAAQPGHSTDHEIANKLDTIHA